MKDMYKTAAKTKLRFPSSLGLLTTEQLFDLPINSKTKVSLQGLGTAILRDSKPTEVFMGESKENEIAKLQLAILEDIILTKRAELAEAQKRATARKMQEERYKLLIEAKNKKRQKAISKMTEAEIDAEIASLLQGGSDGI
jgi:hypothetical protein